MQTNIVWAGLEYHSIENCLINGGKGETAIVSTIIGLYEGKIYKIDYAITVNNKWETKEVSIKARHSDQEQQILLTRNKEDDWIMNNEKAYTFTGCIDVDIALTPFTNTLPINRLNMREGEDRIISVIYFDLLNWDVKPVKQLYRKISENIYHYENIPNNFNADITVDKQGLVIEYPGLFNRTAISTSQYNIL
ncbi:putative glycolipid-binding domain-containing protein [Terrimonas sp. NA20]|uniref:Glycolipid-binding domain-containing protein n=1 Tax=Terrimonas ginsenosidimutans TaxID=2908004 RepID=A0ABS9KSP0_9BACT|nr:putative glycolipid-binding domain-containing protein [Terrimonas ginsenosidimutans]MCG2615302.1 putative glycolipid-binding domain-containing protein [Terrimonas ginsenosidimutans]